MFQGIQPDAALVGTLGVGRSRRRCAFRKTVGSLLAAPLLLALSMLSGCGVGSPTPGAAEPSQHTSSSAAGQSHAEREVVRLTAAEIERLDLATAIAESGTLTITKVFPGEVRVNGERYAHVVARVPGVAVAVHASVGDTVEAGAQMAVLESRELAAATANYLGAQEKAKLAQAHFTRIARLRDKALSTDDAYVEAQQALAAAKIAGEAAEHALQALGIPSSRIEALPSAAHRARFQYSVVAPIDGVVVKRHLVRGEAVDANAEVFEIADLSTVWVDLSIYQRDLARVQKGQNVTVAAGDLVAEGVLSYVRPIVGEATRVALARVELANVDEHWKPGMFVTGKVVLGEVAAAVLIPKTAVQAFEGRTVVFVQAEAGFRPTPVKLGASDARSVEVLEGLLAGAKYVTRGAFTLRAELEKDSFEAGHSH